MNKQLLLVLTTTSLTIVGLVVLTMNTPLLVKGYIVVVNSLIGAVSVGGWIRYFHPLAKVDREMRQARIEERELFMERIRRKDEQLEELRGKLAA